MMKKMLIFLVSCITALSVFAQYNSGSTVTITVNGNKNRQVLVDGKNYSDIAIPVITGNDNSVITNNTPVSITIADLKPGQHKLQLARANQNSNNSRANNTKTFNTRSGYDLLITVNNDGSVQLSETKKKRNRSANNQYKTPMSSATFTALLQKAKKEWRAGPRLTVVTTAFENTSNYFTTAQAKQLIQTITPQTSRLQLAKLSYRSITDPAGFNQVYDLLTTQAAKNELQAYVTTYNNSQANNNGYNNSGYNNNGGYNNGYNNPVRTPMTDASFNIVYRDVQKQFLPGGKMSALTDAFASTSNYFTTAQAKQLILLVSDETNRLQLAKSVYRNTTDPANFSQLYDVLNTQANRNELAAWVTSYKNSNDYNNSSKTPMSDAAYNVIGKNVQSEWTPAAKMSALTNAFAATGNYFTTAQAKQLILLISDESNRLQLAKLSYRTITDPANFSQLYDVLSSQASRNELAAYVSSNNNSTGYNNSLKTPMSDAAYNETVRNVQSQWGLGAKMSALTNVFATTTNYFTTAQAKQLIEMVSEESNRLQLAKSSYANITDPANFSQVYVVLSSQASRNELAAYVNAYARY